MGLPEKNILSRLAQDLGLSEDDLLQQGLRSFLEQQLRKANADAMYNFTQALLKIIDL